MPSHAPLASLPLALAAGPTPTEAAATEEEEEEEQEEKELRRTKGLVMRGFAKVGTATLPGIGIGGGLSVGYLRNRFRVDLMGSGRLNRSAWYPHGEVGGDFALWRAGLRACAVFGSGRISTPLCGGADTGMVTASGVGVASARTERQPWASAFADIDLAWHVLPQVALITTSRWLVPLARRNFYVGDRGTLVTTPPFGVEIGLGLELVLP
ncbi:hypothetical protein [Paraliomyxa miuraensis]|uniref:hypothetical protein n=1 Tax=Paraliomyxa miuraensis TaxID=376150 RepID=UPI00225A4F46|nr:hypothetical protein [Paraliomyxa miuraensis]MCX4246149.1 hypothetical protein [Paraliomyxa miuraensis]